MTNQAAHVGSAFHTWTTSSVSVPYPSGSQSGDLVAMLLDLNDAPMPTLTGWTRVDSTSVENALYYRVRAGESGVGISSGAGRAVIAAYRNLKPVAPLRAAAVQGANVWTLPAYTPAVEASTIVLELLLDSGTAVDPAPTPAGFVERSQSPKVQFDWAGVVSDRLVEAPAVVALETSFVRDSAVSVLVRGYLSMAAVTNRPPVAPLVSMPSSINRTRDFAVNVTAQDPDVGDSTQKTFVRVRRTDVTPLPAWTVLSRTSPTTTVTIPADSLPAARHELQAATRDAGGLPAADADLVWSQSVFFLAADPPAGLVFVTPAAGSVLGGTSASFTVSVTALDSLDYRVLGDASGAPDAASVIVPQSSVTVGNLRAFTVTGLPNSALVHVQARPVLAGIAGEWATSAHQVSYTPPPSLPGSVAVRPFSLAVTSGNPAPKTGQPAVLYVELERGRLRPDGTITPEGFIAARGGLRRRLQVSPGTTYEDGTVASGTDYAYRFHAVGSNGTRSEGPWVTGEIDVTPEDRPLALLDVYAEHYQDTYAALRDYYIDLYTDTYGNHGADPVSSIVEGTV